MSKKTITMVMVTMVMMMMMNSVSIIDFTGRPPCDLVSMQVGPRPKTSPSMDWFQYHMQNKTHGR